MRMESNHWAIIAYGMVSIWLTEVKAGTQMLNVQKIVLAARGQLSSNALGLRTVIDDIAGCGSCEAQPGHADRSRTARKGTRRQSAYIGCKPPQGKASRHGPRQ